MDTPSIFLTGFMGSGKTTIGKMLADKLKLPFVDLDNYIETTTGRTITTIFEEDGEEIFRRIEHDCLKEILAQKKVQVVALGGGTVCHHDSVDLIKRRGMLVYLKVSVNTLAQRLENENQKRPLLQSLTGNELRDFISTKLKERDEFYLQSHLIIDGNDNADNVTKKIIEYLATK